MPILLLKYSLFFVLLYQGPAFTQTDLSNNSKRLSEEKEIHKTVILNPAFGQPTNGILNDQYEPSEQFGTMNFDLAIECVPDSLKRKYVFEIEEDFKNANDSFANDLALFATYFESDESELKGKILLSHCGFSPEFEYAILYFENWIPYNWTADQEVLAGEGGFIFLMKSNENWNVVKIDYFWKAN